MADFDWWVLVLAQAVCAVVLIVRLSRGRSRLPALPPTPPTHDATSGDVSVVIPTLNEAARIGPLLAGVREQGKPVTEILFVDSHSADGTRERISEAARVDARIRLLTDPPVPWGWIGKAWAHEYARRHASGDWILGLDADVAPKAGLVASIVQAAQSHGFDVVSVSPRFAGQTRAERWIQPSLVATLVYRIGAGNVAPSARRAMANGQCMLIRRSVLDDGGGYEPVRASFAEDVSLARHLARRGARVAFVDGHRLCDVRSYSSAREMWREWGRSIDLKDATSPWQQWTDVAFLMLVQGVPLPLLICASVSRMPAVVVALNGAFVLVRAALGVAMKNSYAERGMPYWLSPLTDPLAALRVLISSVRRPRSWRGRRYD